MFNFNRPLEAVLSDLRQGEGAAQQAAADLAQQAGLTAEQFTAALSPSDAASIERYTNVVKAISQKMQPLTNELSPQAQQQFAAMQTKIDQFAAQAQAAETKLAAMEQRQLLGDRYTALKTQAAKLNADGKLTAAQFRKYFPEGETFSAAVERFTLAPAAQPEPGQEKPLTLDVIDAQLQFAATLQPVVELGSVAGRDPLPSAGALDATEAGDMERFILNHPEMSQEEKDRELAKLKQPPATAAA